MNRLRNQRGFSLLEITLAAALLSAISIGAIRFFDVMGKAGGQMNATRTATALKSSLISLVNSPTAWQRTIAEQSNGALECLKKGGSNDCQGKGGPIGVYASDGRLEYDPDASAGFSMGGSRCDGFDGLQGNRACPFRVAVEWEPICPKPAPEKCPSPQVRIVATFTYRPAEERGLAFNQNNFSFSLIRGQPLSNAEEFCLSIGAAWVTETQSCNIKPAACASVGGTYDKDQDSCDLTNDVGCDPDEAVQQMVSQDGVMKAICVPISDEFDPYDFMYIDSAQPGMKDVPQYEARGCRTSASAIFEPDGVACRVDRPAGSAGTCYVRNTGLKEGWYRAGTGWCEGGIYTLDTYTGPGAVAVSP